MCRLALFVLCVAAACSKSAGNQEKVSSPPGPSGNQDVIAVPKPDSRPTMGGPMDKLPEPAAPGALAMAGDGEDARLRLRPEEGTLAIEPPADAKPGAEAVAKIIVTPGKGYHVNTEYPTKLTLESPTGVTLAKAEFTAGGHGKAKGDADAFDEDRLVFAVKLTPAASGSHTVNGKFKFAVCDADQCLAKKETIAITVAAK